MNDLMLYSFVGLVIFYILYAKGVIFADFNFITPDEAKKMIEDGKKDIVILDVRTEMEYTNTGHLPNVILIPVQHLHKRLDELEKFKNHKVLVYCASGNRSVSACRILYRYDFDLYNIKGGINGWKREGLEVTNQI